MHDIPTEPWNELAATFDSPLLNHEWLAHLEASGSMTPAAGWQPIHACLWDDRRLVAAAPLYLRDTSWGEFVFDFAFAELADKIGTPYYPKLVGMSPATPSRAYGFLARDPERDGRRLFDEIEAFCDRNEIGVLQFNYVAEPWRERFERWGMVAWAHHGYQWYNEDFESFDDYLARFTKNQRRNVRRERRSIADQGLEIRMVAGAEAPDSYFEWMYRFYRNTNDQYGPYAARFLSAAFFCDMPQQVRRHVWFVAALRQAERDPVAMAMLVRKEGRVLGRYWGARVYADNLHFNVCYYAPIEWAIAQGVRTFDPGMGSQHKVRRGFRSVANYSVHRFYDRRMDAILRANIDRINSAEGAQIATLDAAVPYKHSPAEGR